MGFDGEDGTATLAREDPEKLPEGEDTGADGQMGVGIAVIIVEMDMTEKGQEGLQPNRQRFPGEGLKVTGIEAEPALRRVQGRQAAPRRT